MLFSRLAATLSMTAFGLGFMSSCQDGTKVGESRLKWGMHQLGRSANLLNLLPGQSVSVCAPNDEWTKNAHEAIRQWSSAIGRWGHFAIKNCNERSTLRIDMQEYAASGLNYFSQNPGRILIDANSVGSINRALILHEFGHSYGLCDQYRDAASASCSDHRSPLQDNDEVMGVSTASKTRLTAGDIEGVKAVAADMMVPANVTWKNFLATLPAEQTTVFAALVDSSAPSNPKIAVSVESGSIPNLCLSKTGIENCESGQPLEIILEKTSSASGRDIYVSKSEIAQFITAASQDFVLTTSKSGTPKTEKFRIKKR